VVALPSERVGHTPCSPVSPQTSSRYEAIVQEDAVLICRCAWHQRYCGYPRLSGVASWRGWAVRFTDGICEKCLERFRAEHRSFLERRRGIDAGAIASSLPDAVPVVSSNEAA
jgi:hypothetical protein